MKVKIQGSLIEIGKEKELENLIQSMDQPISKEIIIYDDQYDDQYNVKQAIQTKGYLYTCPWCGIHFPFPADAKTIPPLCPNCETVAIDGRLPQPIDDIPTSIKQYEYFYVDPSSHTCGEAFGGTLFGGQLTPDQISEKIREWAPRHFGGNPPETLVIEEREVIIYERSAKHLGRFKTTK